jgi:hypothetical protein
MCNRGEFFGIFFLNQIFSENLKVTMMKHVVIMVIMEDRNIEKLLPHWHTRCGESVSHETAELVHQMHPSMKAIGCERSDQDAALD